MRATKNGERSSPAPADIARAWSVPLWTTRETSNAAGAAKKPRKPVTGTRALRTAVPTERPRQTNTAQETFLAKSATMDPRLKRFPNPALSRSSVPSIAMPSRIASQATRRSVAPRFEDAAAEASWVGASLDISSSSPPITRRLPSSDMGLSGAVLVIGRAYQGYLYFLNRGHPSPVFPRSYRQRVDVQTGVQQPRFRTQAHLMPYFTCRTPPAESGRGWI